MDFLNIVGFHGYNSPMADLTADDINVLIEALDAWKDKDAVGELMEDLLPAMLSRSKEEAQTLKPRFAEKQGRAAAKALRKELAIVLQAKLIEMRMRIEAEAQS